MMGNIILFIINLIWTIILGIIIVMLLYSAMISVHTDADLEVSIILISILVFFIYTFY